MRRLFGIATLVALIAVGTAGARETTLRMATIAPSLGQAVTMATFANIVNDRLKDVRIEVAGGGAATLHQLEVGRGNLELAMTSPVIYDLMSEGAAMYAGEPDAAAHAENVRLLMWFPYGEYHFAVRGDSDITLLDDIMGATVFLGPQGGGAYSAASGWIESTTGLVAGEDYEAITASWQTGFQAFLDGRIDMYVNGCLDPCKQFLQFTETEEVRFIGPESHTGPDTASFLGQWRQITEVSDGLYDGQVNESPVVSFDTAVGIAVRADIDEETVYRITRAFWENIEQVSSQAPWAAALDADYAAAPRGRMRLHPGAERYYRERGAL